MSYSPPPPDAERDAWLSHALRHAPDADVAPPPSLSDMILREAQAKVKPAAAPPPATPTWWSKLWDWMARPAVGAGLASVMLASVVGVMMWNRPLEEMSPRPSVDVAMAPAKEPAPASAASVAQPRDRMADAAKDDKPAQSLAVEAAKPIEEIEHKRVDEVQRRAEPTIPKAALKQERPRESGKAAPDALAKAARTAEAMSPASPAVETVVPMGAAAPAVNAPAAPPAPAPMPAPTTAPAPPTNAMNAAPSGPSSALSGQRATAPLPSPPGFAAGLAAAPAERSFVNLRVTLAAEPAPWAWSRDGAPPRPIDDAIAALLADVDSVAASRWQPEGVALTEASDRNRIAANAGPAPAESGAAESVRLWRDGQVQHVLRLDGRVLHWDRLGTDPASVVVTLTDAQLQMVRRALDKLAP